MEYLALDSENHSELYQLLQILIETFSDTINDSSSLFSVSMSLGLLKYREYLKQCYLKHNS